MDEDDICQIPFNFGKCSSGDIEVKTESQVLGNNREYYTLDVKKRGNWVTVTIPTFMTIAHNEKTVPDQLLIKPDDTFKRKFFDLGRRDRIFGGQARVLNPRTLEYKNVPAMIILDKQGDIKIVPANITKYIKNGGLKIKSQFGFLGKKDYNVHLGLINTTFTYCLYDLHEFNPPNEFKTEAINLK